MKKLKISALKHITPKKFSINLLQLMSFPNMTELYVRTWT